MKKFCLAFMSLGLLSACDNDGEKFPGFKAVEVPGQKIVYLYDPQSIGEGNVMKAKNGGKAFRLIHKLEEGYAIQNASTDCGQTLKIEDGFFYPYKGSESKEYPGSGAPFDIGTDGHLRMLIKAVCGAEKIEENSVSTETIPSPIKITPYSESKTGFLTKESYASTNVNDNDASKILIKNGDEVSVTGASSDGEWLEIEYKGYTGRLYVPAGSVAVFQ